MATAKKPTAAKKPAVKKTVKRKQTKKNIVEVKSIVKNYGKLNVLKGISFNVKEGERLAIIGANGAGKSTLTEIISQVKEPTSGTIKFSFADNKADISKNIGIQFQESTYPMFYKTIDIINFFLEASHANISKEQLKKVMKIFHLEGIENEFTQGLSGGQKQRLNVLLAVIHNPKLLLLDEVSTGLDIEAREDIKVYIKKYLDETNSTLMLVSHNPDEITYLVDRIIVIHDGKLYADLQMKDVIKKFKTFDNYITDLFINQFKNKKGEKIRKKGQRTETKVRKEKVKK